MLRLFFIGLACLALSATPVRAEEAPVVESIEISGNSAVKSGQLLEVMETKAADWQFWRERPRLNRSALGRDREAIAQVYQNEGYYQARVEARVEEKAGGARIRLEIEEGQPVVIKRVNLALSPQDEDWRGNLTDVYQRAGLKDGLVFKLAAYRRAKSDLIRALAEQGHPAAKLGARAEVSIRLGLVEVFFKLEPGPELRLGEAVFEGLKETRQSVLENEITWRKGQDFDVRTLEKTQQGLIKLGLFTSVRLEPILDQVRGDLVPIRISLVERSPHSVSVGFGYGNEDQFRIRVTQSNRSLLGLADVLSATAFYSAKSYGGVIDYRQPHFLSRGQDFNLGLGHQDREEVSFSNRRTFGQIGLQRPLWGDLSLRAGYTLEVDRPYDIATARTADEAQQYWVSAPAAGLVLDARDDVLDPKRGFLLNTRLEVAPRFLGSEVAYYQIDSGFRRYRSPNDWLTLAFRVDLATIEALEPTDDLPIFKRLFSGGGRSVRGYPFQKLGPLDADGRPTGGLSLIEGSLEARFPIWEEIRGVVFTDVGHLAETAWTVDFDQFRYTAGVGLRYGTIIGPLRLDLGWQLNPPSEADFSPLQIHFSIGQAF